MRDEWNAPISRSAAAETTTSFQGLTRHHRGSTTPRQQSMQSLTMASKAMRIKSRPIVREVSERRQVGDAESMVNPTGSTEGQPWWKNVTMEEGM